MSRTIEITPDAVRALARSVSSSGGLVGGAARALRSGSLPGDSEVARALTDFRTAWSRALAAIADDVSMCGRAISDALDGWVALDRRVAVGGGGGRVLPRLS